MQLEDYRQEDLSLLKSIVVNYAHFKHFMRVDNCRVHKSKTGPKVD